LGGTPKIVTLSKQAGVWYVCFSCADLPITPVPATGRETRIDVCLKVFLVTAKGEAGDKMLDGHLNAVRLSRPDKTRRGLYG
jgi:hypothetical protein